MTQAPNAETSAERKARQFAVLRKTGELGLHLARTAAKAAIAAFKREQHAEAVEHTLAFTRAVCCVRQTIALERRLAAGDQPGATSRSRATAASDPRQVLLRRRLH